MHLAKRGRPFSQSGKRKNNINTSTNKQSQDNSFVDNSQLLTQEQTNNTESQESHELDSVATPQEKETLETNLHTQDSPSRGKKRAAQSDPSTWTPKVGDDVGVLGEYDDGTYGLWFGRIHALSDQGANMHWYKTDNGIRYKWSFIDKNAIPLDSLLGLANLIYNNKTRLYMLDVNNMQNKRLCKIWRNQTNELERRYTFDFINTDDID